MTTLAQTLTVVLSPILDASMEDVFVLMDLFQLHLQLTQLPSPADQLEMLATALETLFAILLEDVSAQLIDLEELIALDLLALPMMTALTLD